MIRREPIARLSLALLTSLLACSRGEQAAVQDSDTARPADRSTVALDSQRAESVRAAPWLAARQRGVDFRAVGQEPGWFLEIDSGTSIYLVADYGEKKVSAPAPVPRTDANGTITYDTTANGHHLTAVIRRRTCHDAMNGDEFTHEVTVTLDGKAYRGCGKNIGG